MFYLMTHSTHLQLYGTKKLHMGTEIEVFCSIYKESLERKQFHVNRHDVKSAVKFRLCLKTTRSLSNPIIPPESISKKSKITNSGCITQYSIINNFVTYWFHDSPVFLADDGHFVFL